MDQCTVDCGLVFRFIFPSIGIFLGCVSMCWFALIRYIPLCRMFLVLIIIRFIQVLPEPVVVLIIRCYQSNNSRLIVFLPISFGSPRPGIELTTQTKQGKGRKEEKKVEEK